MQMMEPEVPKTPEPSNNIEVLEDISDLTLEPKNGEQELNTPIPSLVTPPIETVNNTIHFLTMTDPIADLLTRIRNAVKANHKVVEAPGSKIKQEIVRILHEQGYILAYKFGTNEKGFSTIKIALKYHPETKTPAIKALTRVSRPGLRQYASVAEMPRVMNGLGIAIVSTSKGIMTDKQARKENVGGEVLCYVY